MGQQYIWKYRYPGGAYSYEEMVAPVGVTVELDITSRDVAHSWWIPKLGGKFDAIPGYVNHTWFRLQRPGVYRGQCAELCGRNHADMLARVRGVSPAEYVAWLARQKQSIQAADAEALTPPIPGGEPIGPRCPPSSRQRVLARRRRTRRSSPTASIRGPRAGWTGSGPPITSASGSST